MNQITSNSDDPFLAADQQLARGQRAEAIRILTEMGPSTKREASRQLRLARIYLDQGDAGPARLCLDAAAAAGARAEHVLRLKIKLAKRTDDAEALRHALAELSHLRPDDGALMYERAVGLLAAGALDDARGILTALEALEDQHSKSCSLRYRIAYAAHDTSGIVEALQRALSQAGELPVLPDLADALGELPEADRNQLLPLMLEQWPELRHRNRYLRHYGSAPDLDDAVAELMPNGVLPPAAQFQRETMILSLGQEVIVSAPGTTGTTVLVFGNVSAGPPVFGAAIEAHCAALGHRLIYLRDASRRVYLAGIGTLAADFDGTITALKALLRETGTQRLLVAGISASAFAAIRYAARLEAEAVLCLSAPTTGTSEARLETQDRRARLMVGRMQSLFDAQTLDLKPDIEAAAGRTTFALWYGADHAVDCAHAERVKHCAGVECHPLPGIADHNILPDMLRSGAIHDFLDRK